MRDVLRRWTGLILFFQTLVAVSAALAQQDAGIFTDPTKAGVDYRLQGEYLGEGTPEGDTVPIGAQVIALGDGKFRLVGMIGGLPGSGWSRGGYQVEAPGERTGDKATFRDEAGEWTARIEGDTLKAYRSGGALFATLKKQHRKSPTLGAQPPAGAVVLYDGSSAKAFDGGKRTDGGWLMANCESIEKFGDHSAHIEFRTPFKPKARGQARGNSGVYIQSRYEVQVLDSFGLEGEDNECGGIYSISKPSVNMCFPPLAWQTYDYDFTAATYDDQGSKTENARVTIRHNGVVIHDDLELPKHTPGKRGESPEAGPLYLQGHGNPVVYRNIWVVKR